MLHCLSESRLSSSQVYFWRDSSQLRWLSVSRAMKNKAFSALGPGVFSGVLDGLFPYSNYKMHIVVANNRYDGPPSHTIQFSTLEGGEKLTLNKDITTSPPIPRSKNLIQTKYAYFPTQRMLLVCPCVCLQFHLFPSPSGSNSDIWTPFMWTGTCQPSPTGSSPATH